MAAASVSPPHLQYITLPLDYTLTPALRGGGLAAGLL